MITGPEASLAADRSSRQRRLIAVGAAIVGILAVLALLLAVRWHHPQRLSGDEPHYLVLANSLIVDGDFDVRNDYVFGRYHRYYRYFAFPIDPHVNTKIFTLSSPHWYSQHGVGVATVIAPGVVVADTAGAAATMVVIAVAVLILAFLWVRRFTGGLWLPAIATGALGISPFFFGLEGRIFPDLPTAALLLGCLLILEMRRQRAWHLLLLGALVGLSPWFHVKNALAFGTVAALAFVQVARDSSGADRVRRLLLLTVPVLVCFVGYELIVRDWYGSWLPTRMFPPGTKMFAISVPRGIAATAFDSARGLLALNPALILILGGLPIWMRRWPGPFLRLMLVIGPTILFQATFKEWSGGFSPAGRYALQFAPALIPAIGLLLGAAPRVFRVLASALLAFQLALAVAFVWLQPSWGFGSVRSPFLAAVDERLGPALDRGMPTFDLSGRVVRGEWQLAAWIAVSVMLVAYGVRRSRIPAGRGGSS